MLGMEMEKVSIKSCLGLSKAGCGNREKQIIELCTRKKKLRCRNTILSYFEKKIIQVSTFTRNQIAPLIGKKKVIVLKINLMHK